MKRIPQVIEEYPTKRAILSKRGDCSETNVDAKTVSPKMKRIKPKRIFVSPLWIVTGCFFFFLGIMLYII